MKYRVELKPRAIKDLRRLPRQEASRVADALSKLQDDLRGDVKRLTRSTAEYRLRVGTHRALFQIEEGDLIVVYRIVHRRDAYR